MTPGGSSSGANGLSATETVAVTGGQQSNQTWWTGRPMTYEGREKIGHPAGTREWFREIDRRFLDAAFFARGSDGRPFGRFLWPQIVSGAEVLEIGCGMGTHAQLLAEAGAKLTAVDLTEEAVSMTRRRFAVNDLQGRIEQADAEHLPFADESFDVVWSWGVLHHSNSFERCLSEVNRVLRPGGHLMMMVYRRPSLRYEVHIGLVRGLLMGQRVRRSFQEIYSEHSDGAFARMFHRSEMFQLLGNAYKPIAMTVTGEKSELFPIPASTLKLTLERRTPDRLASAILSRLGFFLVVEAVRRR